MTYDVAAKVEILKAANMERLARADRIIRALLSVFGWQARL